MMNFGVKLPILTIFCELQRNPTLVYGKSAEKGPLFREFWAQKPTHMGGTYLYPKHVMYPPPGSSSHIYQTKI